LIGVYFPFGWIVPICVGGALFGHVLVFRRLRHDKQAGTPQSSSLGEAPTTQYG
jgi:hypothetical protein